MSNIRPAPLALTPETVRAVTMGTPATRIAYVPLLPIKLADGQRRKVKP
ncbi:hypothetical protein [Sphingobium lignivorans]|uniref:Uncharacterized protein n=1 Tax=Sphingobium lignivorans TaxID=2735886 RepID=A0ABR6NJG4_9SPHN|nr:hypothetical protein [Sphingobium lignivorans]MBB5987401.1 hypothetical protein [Sphingobium lignivorans]